MNNKVNRSPAEEPVRLAVYDASGSRVDVPSEEVEDGGSIVWIDPSDDGPSSIYFTIRMDSETTSDMSDLQYVVETSPFEGMSSSPKAPPHGSPSNRSRPAPSPMTPTIPIPVKVSESSFVKASGGGGILCDGMRGHARGKNGSVNYELVTTVATKQAGDALAEIVAGYSEYHGAVTLTPRVLFKRREDRSESISTTANQGEL